MKSFYKKFLCYSSLGLLLFFGQTTLAQSGARAEGLGKVGNVPLAPLAVSNNAPFAALQYFAHIDGFQEMLFGSMASIVVTETSGTPNDGTICAGASATLTANVGDSYAWSTGATTQGITVTPAATITYTVTVTTMGTPMTASSTITVVALPVPSIAIMETSATSANDGITCTGEMATLTASGGGTYLWSTGSTTAAITVGLAGTYTVTVTGAAGCTASTSRNIVVLDNSMPPPAGVNVCRNDVPLDLSMVVPTASSFMGNGVVGNIFTPADVLPPTAQNVVITVNYACPLPDDSYTAPLPVRIYDPPNATLKDYAFACAAGMSGTLSLSVMMTPMTTNGGTWSLVGTGGTVNGDNFTYDAPGCFQIRYTAPNPNDCDNAILMDDAYLLITGAPDPDFSVEDGASDCFETGTAPRTIQLSANALPAGGTYLWEVTTTGGLNATIDDPTAQNPIVTIDFSGAPDYSAGSVQVCLTETIDVPAGPMCGGLDIPDACSSQICKTISVIQLPNCDTDCPGIQTGDPCDIDVNPEFSFSCSFFSISLGQVLFADVHGYNGQEEAISCTTEEVCVEYDAQFMIGGLAQEDLPSMGDLPLVGAICDFLQFCICVDLGLFEIEIRPFGWVPSSFCDDDILTFILDAFGGGQGYEVWADTDGDGNFDTKIDEQNLSNLRNACFPNNVSGEGTITVRIVASGNGAPSGPCQDPAEPLNLLDVLPIDAIPFVGTTIAYIIEVAGCGVDVGFSDYDDYQVFVYNDQPPAFVNCPGFYTFSDGPNCNTFVNWSAPVATDNCDKTVVNNVIQLTDPSTWPASIPQNETLTPGSFVAYDPAGNNDYTIVYEATACNGLTNHCAFTVNVSPGQTPILVCPPNLVLNNDIDLCTKVATGLTPMGGLGCDTDMSWTAWEGIANPPAPGDIISTGVDDASGTVFPVGVNTVQYTLDAPDQNGNPTTQVCTFTVTIEDSQLPEIFCQDLQVQLDNEGSVTVTAAQVDGGTTDNCGDVEVSIQTGVQPFDDEVTFDCFDIGTNTVVLRAEDEAGNVRNCLAQITVVDFFEGFTLDFDVPEICLEANNPAQLDFSNYLVISQPNGTTIPHSLVGTLGPQIGGYFGITAFGPAPGSGTTIGTSPATPGDIGYIDPFTGVYTPGAGTGYVTISYLLTVGAQVAQNGAIIEGCHEIVHDVFELRQPLEMGSPECECIDVDERIVDLGVITGGLEPYTIQYTGVRLDVDGDGVEEDADGEYTYDVANGHDITDFMEDLGELRVVYTIPVWSFTIVDARGCELFRSGSCDNDDLTEGPMITCPPSNHTLTTEEYACESQYSWIHPLPTDNCAVVLYDYRILNPDGTIEGPFTLNALLNTAPGAPLLPFFTATYRFQLGTSTITYYAEDAQGNFIQCSFQVTVSDDDAPNFLNCPAPPVVQNAESGHCDAYVDFALPLAKDNCDNVASVVKIDNTGLNTGSRFPVGTTIMYWETSDIVGNKDTCQIKVIVNDYWQDPILTCPANKTQDNDPWLCGAVVNNIAPTVDGPCENNYGVTYTIYGDAALTQVLDCGVTNASGEFFEEGDSWVKYTVQNQPLMLITEVTQSGAVDRLEISNLGPADIDISCLEVRRTAINPAANQTLGPVTLLPSLAGSILPVGSTRVFDFTFDGSANMPACYAISYMGTIFDEVSTNGYAGCNGFTGSLSGGDVIRKCEDDTDTAADWVLAQNCYPLTIGSINPDLEVMADNGTQTSLQSIEPNKVSCTFKVTIKDVEDPFCGRLTSNTTYAGAAIPNISAATCNRSTITIPAGNCIIGDIVFNRTGTATPLNSTMTLISPKGIKVVVTEIPDDSLSTLFAQKAEGVWTLDVVPFPGQTPTVTGWSLTINCLAPFNVANQVLPNQAGQCGAPFTWVHPYFVDNCFDGTISVAYTTSNAACVPTGGPLLGSFVKGGYSNTQFFCVGTTLVTYTLTDASGNTSTCGFSVTVNDVERPVVTCPPQLFINLDGGDCGAYVNYNPIFAGDNCAVVDTTMTPPSGSWFDIGDRLVTIVVTDAAGNTRSCTFTVSVIEYVPTDFNLICNDLEHVSMDASCTFILNADGALEGNNYHCYEDYIITVKNQQQQNVDNNFDASDIGKTFTVTVLDPETGNSCWTLLKIEDKLVPALTCPNDITIACSESTGTAHTGNVVVADCSNFTTVVDDEYTDFGQCNDPRGEIVRTWIVTDAWANQSACSQTITITTFDLQDLIFPVDLTVNCESAYLNPGAIQPDNTGRPSINGFPIGVGGLCTASISYTDERFDICPGSYEILRTWKVRNTCFPVAADNPISHVQVITVSDLNGPTFTCPPTVTVSTNPFQCCATAALPSMVVSEGCSHILDLEAKVTGTNPNNGNIITFTVSGSLSDFPGNNHWTPDTLAVFDYTQCLPLGTYEVRYKASDECGNTSYCNFQLKVADLVPPAVACDQVTQVALTTDGEAIVPAANFDDGTTDNCCLEEFLVRRMDANSCSGTSFGATVKFCCSDIGDTVMVVFRAVDCHDNVNDCMVSVLVEDKIKPACQPPAQVVVNCENFDPSLWAYGKAEVTDNCCLDDTREYQGQLGLTHSASYTQFDTVCNRGTITRTFRAYDCGGNSSQCTQRVIVTYEQDYFVKFPNDAIVTVCDGTGNFGEPLFFGEDCELLGISHNDEIFTVVPDACFKIERTWQIINWCTFNPNLPLIDVPNPNPLPTTNAPGNLPGPTVSACGTIAPWAPTVVKITPTDLTATNFCTFWDANANGYRYKQIIKITDGQAPTATYTAPDCSNQNWFTANNAQLWNEMYWWDNGIQTHDLCEEPTDLCITGTDACSGSNVNIEYLLFLDLDGDGVMETVINSVNVGLAGLGWNNVLYNNLNTPNFSGGTPRNFDERAVPGNQKYGFSIQETVTGTTKTACVRWNTQQQQNNHVVPELPHGTHKVKWFVTDGCGNNAEYEYTFTVKDCKAPTVVCLNGLSANIMPTGMITLWASDFLQYTEDNCTPSGQIKIGIRKCGQGTGFPVDANGNPVTQVTFTCAEEGLQCVELWAIDAQGNADYCETYVIVQDNLGNCGTGNHINVSGALKTETGEGVEEATVHVSGTSPLAPPFAYFDLTDSNGVYQFVNLLPLEATFAIAPEKDDNPLNGVTTYDLVLISKHILGLEPLNSPYKMIAADANKSGSITTFDIVEIRKLILGIYTELPNNTSWRFVDKAFSFPNANNPFQTSFPEVISVAGAMSGQHGADFAGVKIGDVNNTAVANALMQAEERTSGTAIFDIEDREVRAGEEFEVSFQSAAALKGFQFTATLDGLTAVDVVKTDNVNESNFNMVSGAMAVSIDGAQEFTVRFRAEKAGSLSRMLGVSGAITRAEAYPALGGSRLDVAFRFDGKTLSGVGFELYQNQPNPFVNRTVVGFFLPEAAEATLSVFDESGRVVYQQKGRFAKGENTVQLDRALINTTGVLYYRLETETDSATRKMVQAK